MSTTHKKSLVVLDTGLGRPVTALKELYTQGQVLQVPLDQPPRVISADTRHVSLPDGVAFSAKHQRLYFTNMGSFHKNDGSVYSMALDGSDAKIVVPEGKVHTPKQLAIDSVNEKLYFCDREGMRVLRCNLDGSDFEVLIQTGDLDNPCHTSDILRWCVGIAVSPQKGLFYWTQKGPAKGGQGRIFCAPMESSGPRAPICVIDRLPEPIDLFMHQASNTIYWTDRGEVPYGNSLNRLSLDSSSTQPAVVTPDALTGLRYELLTKNFDEAIGLEYDEQEDVWYVVDLGGTVWRVDAKDWSITQVYQDKERAFTGIAIIH